MSLKFSRVAVTTQKYTSGMTVCLLCVLATSMMVERWCMGEHLPWFFVWHLGPGRRGLCIRVRGYQLTSIRVRGYQLIITTLHMLLPALPCRSCPAAVAAVAAAMAKMRKKVVTTRCVWRGGVGGGRVAFSCARGRCWKVELCKGYMVEGFEGFVAEEVGWAILYIVVVYHIPYTLWVSNKLIKIR